MNSISGKELAKLLERNGWILLRVNGSHHIYGKLESPVRISVPIHGNKSLKIGLLKNLLKMAGLSENTNLESNAPGELTHEDISNEPE